MDATEAERKAQEFRQEIEKNRSLYENEAKNLIESRLQVIPVALGCGLPISVTAKPIFSFEGGKFEIVAKIEIDCGKYIIDSSFSQRRWIKAKDAVYYHTTQNWVHDYVNSMCEVLGGTARNALPQSIDALNADKPSWCITLVSSDEGRGKQPSHEIVKEFTEREVPNLTEHAKTLLTQILEEQAVPADSVPSDVMTGTIDAMNISVLSYTVGGATFKMSYTIRYSDNIAFRYTTGKQSKSFLAEYAEGREPFERALKLYIESTIQNHFCKNEKDGNYALYIKPFDPKPLETALKATKKAMRVSDNVAGHFTPTLVTDINTGNAELYTTWGNKRQLLRYYPNNGDVRKEEGLYWDDYQKSIVNPYSENVQRGPNTIFEFAEFVKLARTTYKGFATAGQEPQKLTFNYANSGGSEQRVISYKIGNFNGELTAGEMQKTTIGEWLKDFCYRATTIEQRKQNCEEMYVKALNDLSLTALDLHILEAIYRDGRTWYTKICTEASTTPAFTKDAIGEHLEKICKVKLPNEMGTPVLAVRSRLVSSYSYGHGSFWLYEPNLDIPVSVFSAATPRPYTSSDVDEMTTKSREPWVSKYLSEITSKEEQWEGLQLLDKMPKTFVAKFVKTEDGKAFFSRLEGDDATYASLMLQNIPGCKTFAKTLGKETGEQV